MAEPMSDRLTLHLRSWVGEWPPPSAGVHVVGDPARLEPTWDGALRPLQGVSNGAGTVISVPPAAADAVRRAIGNDLVRPGLGDELGSILGVGPSAFGAGIFRTTDRVDPELADLGEWFEDHTDELPDWLAPFNGPRLVAHGDAGRPIAGVGIKVHDDYGQELSVVTEEEARGLGYARRLVATAARRVLDEGLVPTYLHAPDNTASARVAESVGFADRGWKVYGLWPRSR
ncbi:MAG TPA: GNAT family N-acetyltransferase [Ilumatobacteraceae bacterium]|nr:GNAT family N-acetyltransferase [Ilumatobacteraceae bacterium]